MNSKPFDWRTFRGHAYLIGNGGSYANAVHIANDLLSCGIRAHTLDPASLTATANDFGYAAVFDRWICIVGQPGDLLIALSGSGKSPNILNALATAKAMEMTTWAVFGAYNHHDARTADILTLAGDNMQEAEEHQLVWGHEIMRRLKGNGPVATLADGREVHADGLQITTSTGLGGTTAYRPTITGTATAG